MATLSDPPFYGEVGASTYVIGPVSAFFCEMAEAWTGWDGVKRWTSLDGELTHAVQGGGWSAGFPLNEGNATFRFVCGTPPHARHWTTASASTGRSWHARPSRRVIARSANSNSEETTATALLLAILGDENPAPASCNSSLRRLALKIELVLLWLQRNIARPIHLHAQPRRLGD
ncbi:hypothetical protein [Paraburkholderia sp. NMBU_R16]|uniref:hypothetical protein n=1 Tax=Paraburkholderia sp. NMBU_R16 TaxID=2698676 RepID=UPI00349F11BF